MWRAFICEAAALRLFMVILCAGKESQAHQALSYPNYGSAAMHAMWVVLWNGTCMVDWSSPLFSGLSLVETGLRPVIARTSFPAGQERRASLAANANEEGSTERV